MMMLLHERKAKGISASSVVTKAVVRAGDNLELSNALLAKIIGLSAPSVTRMRQGNFSLEGKPFELAALFLRVYRSLDAITSGDDAVARQWLRNDNSVLRDKPIELIQKVEGLMHVLEYLDARRALV